MFFKKSKSNGKPPFRRAHLPILVLLQTLLQVACQSVVIAAVPASENVRIGRHAPESSASDFGRQGYNVIALADPTTGDILEQYTYEPYGSLIAAERFNTNLAVNRVGHQGLFFERFEGTFTDAALDQPPPGLPIGATNGLYNNRNRFYHPGLGRFTTRDPNETGIPILTAMAMNGEAMASFLGAFSARSLFGDGMNLYQYERCNPVSRNDPRGLETLVSVLTGSMMTAALATIYDAPWAAAKADTPGQLIQLLVSSYLYNFAASIGGPGTAIAANILKSLGTAFITKGEVNTDAIVRAAVTAALGGSIKYFAKGIGNNYNYAEEQVRVWSQVVVSVVNNVLTTSIAFAQYWMSG